MERLTENIRNHDGSAVSKKSLVIEHGLKKGMPSAYCGAIVTKLADYEDAEENGLMKILPVAIGSDVYFIPSKVNYDLNVLSKHEENNRVYHQKVARITFTERGWYLELDKNLEYGVDHILVDKFHKETWFTSSDEAEQALADMRCK